MTDYHHSSDWLHWIDELSEHNFVVIDDFLDEETFQRIKHFFSKRLAYFENAGIGIQTNNQVKKSIRGDFTYWLDRKRDRELDVVWQLIEETKATLNRYCFLSLSDYEFHLAHYPPGSFYARHLDQFASQNNRMISTIIYLNDKWEKGDGGELELVLDKDEVKLVEPIARRCVMFKSSAIEHGVLKANKSRYSLTGWFLYNPPVLRDLLG